MSDKQDVIMSAVRANSDSMETEFSGTIIKSITLTESISARYKSNYFYTYNKAAVL